MPTVFITGTSSGIDLAAAQVFYQEGWNVIATMRTPANDQEPKGLDANRIIVLCLDLRDRNFITEAVEAGIQKFSKIDLLLNNAGYGQNGIFEMLTREIIQEQFDVTSWVCLLQTAHDNLESIPNAQYI